MEVCFDVSLTSREFLLYHHHKDYCASVKEEMKLIDKETNQTFCIEKCTNLLEIKSIVSQIESILKTRFEIDIVYAYFAKPLKGKKQLQKWWKETV